jgi:hypothetical protein
MIVIPMAGASRRFRRAGYAQAKFMLPLQGETVFAHAVRSFSDYFASDEFLFIIGPDQTHRRFVEAECDRLGLAAAMIAQLAGPTAGQAETVAHGLTQSGHGGPITIFNIDTFRPGFKFPEQVPPDQAGWLEVFRGAGDNWSYVKLGPGDEVIETAEKRPISDLCCTGLYHFEAATDFHWALGQERARPQASELYVAPLYNHLIATGRTIGYRRIEPEEVIFCGTPDEYADLVTGR